MRTALGLPPWDHSNQPSDPIGSFHSIYLLPRPFDAPQHMRHMPARGKQWHGEQPDLRARLTQAWRRLQVSSFKLPSLAPPSTYIGHHEMVHDLSRSAFPRQSRKATTDLGPSENWHHAHSANLIPNPLSTMSQQPLEQVQSTETNSKTAYHGGDNLTNGVSPIDSEKPPYF